MLSDEKLIQITDRLLKEQPEIFEALLEAERTKRVPKFTYKRRYNFTLDPELMRKFKASCDRQSVKMSTRIEQLMRREIEK